MSDEQDIITKESIGGKLIQKKWYWNKDHHEFTSINLVSADNYFSEYVTDGATIDMAVNGTTPVVYSYTVLPNTEVTINRGFFVIEDGAVAFNPGNFAALGASLSNGVEISITHLGSSKIVLENWKTNRQVRDTMFDFDQTFKTDGVYTGRWSFTKDLISRGFILNEGDKFEIKIQDNLSGLDYMSFKLKGNKR